MKLSQVTTARMVSEEVGHAAVPGAGHVEVQAAKTGQEAVLAVPARSRAAIADALGPGIPIV